MKEQIAEWLWEHNRDFQGYAGYLFKDVPNYCEPKKLAYKEADQILQLLNQPVPELEVIKLLNEWKVAAKHGTSGEMVWGLLDDFEKAIAKDQQAYNQLKLQKEQLEQENQKLREQVKELTKPITCHDVYEFYKDDIEMDEK